MLVLADDFDFMKYGHHRELGSLKGFIIPRETEITARGEHPGYCNKSAVLGLIAVLDCVGWVGSDAGFDSWV